jgi:4-amino-4-deoxy-L-arabinose transferase-like glycosyltransferase
VASPSEGASRRLRRLPQAIPVILAGLFVALVLLFYPFRFVFELDPDEGIQLMKAMLHASGLTLYGQIYSDQPPLFTILLSGLIRLFGAKVLPARLAVLGFSTVLLVAAGEQVRRTWGWAHAATAVAFLALIPAYLQLSASVMVGLPAISVAVLSLLCLTIWHAHGRTAWLILAAALLAASVMIKLFTVVLAPAVFAGVLLIPHGAARARLRWADAGLWSLVFAGVLAVLALLGVGPAHLGQLVETHLGAQGIAYFAGETLVRHTRDLWPLFGLAVIGVGMCVTRRVWTSLYFGAWLVLAGVLLALNTPVWYHQQLLVAVPGAVLAGIGLAEAIQLALRRGERRRGAILLGLVAIGLAALYLAWAVPRFVSKLHPDMPNLVPGAALTAREYDLLTLVDYFDPDGQLLITDRPMFSFRSRRELPPELANLSQKVLRGGVVTEAQIIEMIENRAAPVVLLGRFDLPEVQAYLKQHYDQVYGYIDLRLFVRNPSE